MWRRILPEPGPARVLTGATLINTLGNGLWMTSSAIFLTRSVGLAEWQVGVGLTLAALISLLASTPMGYLADRRGPRGMLIAFLLAQAGFAAALTLVASFAAFLVVAALAAIAESGQRGARGAMIAGAIPAEQRVRTRAYLRATTNVGISVGAALAGVGLAADTRTGYLVMIAGNAATYVLAAVISLRAPGLPPQPKPAEGPRLIALRDRPFLAYTVLDGLLSMHFVLLELILPLWISTRTAAPRWLVSVLFLINTSMVVALQVRAARGTERLAGAARAARLGGLFIALACVLFAGTAAVPAVAAVALLSAGAFVHVLGELRQSAAGWGISFGLAPDRAQGQYQGAYAMGMQLGHMVAPAALTGLVLGGGVIGWLVCAGLFAALGMAVPPVVRWAQHNRPVPAAETVHATKLTPTVVAG